MAKISVSLLNSNWSNLEVTMKKLLDAKFNNFHMDVMDGNFVSDITFGHEFCKTIKKLSGKNYVEAHLMVNDPYKHLSNFQKIGIDALIVHFETLYYREINQILFDIKGNKMLAGLTIKPNTNIEQIYEYLKNLDIVMIMSVEPGKGGQSFIPTSIERIKKLDDYRKQHSLKFEILVDGGITPETCKLCTNAGADRFVVGSYIFKQKTETQAFKDFENI